MTSATCESAPMPAIALVLLLGFALSYGTFMGLLVYWGRHPYPRRRRTKR